MGFGEGVKYFQVKGSIWSIKNSSFHWFTGRENYIFFTPEKLRCNSALDFSIKLTSFNISLSVVFTPELKSGLRHSWCNRLLNSQTTAFISKSTNKADGKGEGSEGMRGVWLWIINHWLVSGDIDTEQVKHKYITVSPQMIWHEVDLHLWPVLLIALLVY